MQTINSEKVRETVNKMLLNPSLSTISSTAKLKKQ